MLFVKKGYTKAARCKSAKSLIEKFNWKQLQVKKLNRYLQNVRRSFKFVCEVTVAEFGLVSKGLDAIGHAVTETMDDEEKLAKITKRLEDMGGVYKMIQLAVNDERSNITKKMMVRVQGESNKKIRNQGFALHFLFVYFSIIFPYFFFFIQDLLTNNREMDYKKL